MEILPFDVLWDLLQKPKKGIKNQIIADCPKCGKSAHFYINAGYNHKGVANPFDCKKCNFQGNIVTLLLFLNKLDLLAGRQVDLKKQLPKLSRLSDLNMSELDIEIPKAKLPIGFRRLSYNDGSRFTEYLKTRKFTELDFEIYKPGYTNLKRKYQDYVIIPITRNWEVCGYVTRYIGDDDNKPRYLNSEHDFSKLLAGYDELEDTTTTAILVEGFFDKTSVTFELDLYNHPEIKCLSTFGKKISEVQLFLLKQAGIENLFLMFDGRDAIKDMKKIGFQIKKQFRNILSCDTGRKFDPGASNKEMILDVLSKSKSVERFYFDKLAVLKLK